MANSDKPNDAVLHLAVAPEEAGGATHAYATIRVRGPEGGWKERVQVPLGDSAGPLAVAVPSGTYSVDVLMPSGQSLSETGQISSGDEQTIVLKPLATSMPAGEAARGLGMALESSPLERVPRSSPISIGASPLESVFGSLSPLESVRRPRQTPAARSMAPENAAAATTSPAATLKELLGETAALRFWQYSDGRWQPLWLPIAQSGVDPQRAVFVVGKTPFPLLLAEVRGVGSGEAVFCRVPAAWRDRRGTAAEVALQLWVGSSAETGLPRLRLQAVVGDTELATLSDSLAYGAGNDLFGLGESVAAHAQALLSEKERNPWLAAAAALALLKSGRLSSLHEWTLTLATRFPFLPDGAVIAAWNILYSSRDKTLALRWLLDASERGLPLFSESLRLLVSGLRLFGTEHDEAARHWERYLWASRADAVFMSFRGGDPASPGKPCPDGDPSEPHGVFMWKTA